MASKLLALRSVINKPLNGILGQLPQCLNTVYNLKNFSTTSAVSLNFFNKLPAEKLWKSVTSVSNAGAKKGRGKGAGRIRTRDLNRGQMIGVGKINMLWPGLSAPVIRGKELLKQQRLPDDPERMEKLIKLRDSMTKFRRFKLSPIERGWSGSRMPGRSTGPPDPVGDEEFTGFDTKVLQLRSLLIMKGTLGRTRNYQAVVVTGNGQGLAGFGIGRSKEAPAALRKAKNRAGKKLMDFEVCDGHTVFHDFFTAFGKTKLYVQKKNKGYGLSCHRAIKEICEAIGIKDLRAKLEGSNNLQHIVKAFFIGLLQQRTHQQLAEEKKLHLVEYRAENEEYPTVVASPSYVRTKEEIPKDETLDFSQYVMNDRIILRRKKFPRFYETMPHYEIYLKKYEKYRNHEKIRLNLKTEYGEVKSFLNDKYPEPKEEKEA
ncbi:28S ribosomal protein S5, mitochondrial [Pararge aegeria]|uniref:Small ribosomal subunit protein uS5m n=1 Tax=Pararge aegeria aegeria TaxID=348720 RepID=A0A8S4S154_9NEOP|nr:28S ribosomal protein S5, mitochondrial [Pararge aegeria]CAH2245082.1 jg15920 [Pararge aegeria aegeria]